MLSVLKRIYDNSSKNSLAHLARKKRFNFFIEKLEKLEKPIKILDVGGTQEFWNMMNFVDWADVEVHLLNLEHQKTDYPNFISVKGDATCLSQYENNSFDLVFSNSVIEHVFTWENQVRMATEIRRVGKNYFIQTPNYWFPIEPPFRFSFFSIPTKISQDTFNYEF